MTADGKTPEGTDRTPAALDDVERLLWGVLHRLESLALGQYEAHTPSLATASKRALVARLAAEPGTDAALESSELAEPVRKLVAAARGPDALTTLLVQGVVLERLGQAIYNKLRENKAVGPATRSLGEAGAAAAAEAAAAADKALAESGKDGEQIFNAFAAATRPLLATLDVLGGPVDKVFGERVELHFADLLGEFTSELLPACLAAGMNRRKVVCHLTAAFMGH